MNSRQRELRTLLRLYIPQVTTFDEYTPDEFISTKAFLDQFQSYFKPGSITIIAEVFTCTTRYINYQKNVLDEIGPERFKDRGKEWQLFHKMIPVLNYALLSLDYGEFEPKGEELFPIKRIIFESDEKEKINGKYLYRKYQLEGPILHLLRGFLKPVLEVYSKEQKELMRKLSFELYDSIEEFKGYLLMSYAQDDSIAKQRLKHLNEANLDTALNRMKYQLAFQLSNFIKAHSNSTSCAKFPSHISKIIGSYYQLLGLDTYLDHQDNKKISNYIKRGNPINS